MRPIIVWFRRDLRVEDHAALYAAAQRGVPIVPLFIVDTTLVTALPSDGAVFDFQAACLRDLAASLRKLGGDLILREGGVEDVHRRLIEELQPAALYYNRDYEPYARTRDEGVDRLYRNHGVEVVSFRDSVVHEPSEVLTKDGRPYVVFTPFSRTWKTLSHPEPFGTPRKFSTPAVRSAGIPGAAELGRETRIVRPAFRGGIQEAQRTWNAFIKEGIGRYDTGRDFPAEQGTSRLSPYLRFGCISPRTVLADCADRYRSAGVQARAAIQKYVDELIWREFYQAVLFHFPHLLTSNYRREFDRMPWSRSERTLTAWKEGRTGFPLVDAGMRELNTTGWMHNRVRMVVASFLTKDLLHDWKKGARVFEEKLMDIETASNNGGWQWSASTGVDPKPLRIFNPTLQAQRFDPRGSYIRAHVPELSAVPDRFIHAPHLMPPVLQKELGCVIGRDYPAPIVDHAAGSAKFREAYAMVKERKT